MCESGIIVVTVLVQQPAVSFIMFVLKAAFLVLLLANCGAYNRYNGAHYEIPDPEIQVFKPKGLRVSIADSSGVEVFAFHGNVNKPMNGLEAGTFSKDVLRAKNGTWIFEDPNARLQIGDQLYYWLFVIKNGLGYRLDNGHFVVTGSVFSSKYDKSNQFLREHNGSNKFNGGFGI